jgi:hypothetical protein
MNQIAAIGHNSPPDPIDTICAAYEDARTESESWLDGSPVENEGQMQAVDALRKSMRECRLALEAGQKSATAPIYDVYKAELARWKPTIEDAKRIEAGLVAATDAFKRKLAAEKAEAERKAAQEAYAARKAAEEAMRAADASNIDAQREAAAKLAEADEANRRAAEARKDTVKGMRKVWRHEVTDHRALLNHIATADRDAVTRFIEQYAAAHFKQGPLPGVRAWQDSEAF